MVADRAVEVVRAGLQVGGGDGLAALRDGLALLLDAVALDLDGVRDVGRVVHRDRDLARLGVSVDLSNFRALLSAASVMFSPPPPLAAASVAVGVGVLSDLLDDVGFSSSPPQPASTNIATNQQDREPSHVVSSCQNRRPVRTSLVCPRSSR